MISFLWEVCIPTSLTAYIFQAENYQIIADPKLTYQKANKIVKQWIANANVTDVSSIISSNFKSIHFIYSSLYPKIYSRINSFGIKNKGDFERGEGEIRGEIRTLILSEKKLTKMNKNQSKFKMKIQKTKNGFLTQPINQNFQF